VQELRCGGCGLHMGMYLKEEAKNSNSDVIARCAKRLFIVKRYLRLHHSNGDCIRPPGTVVCSCGNMITYADQLLSSAHRWSVGEGTEAAGYYNALHKGSYSLHNKRSKFLAQGLMIVADVHCKKCESYIGWAFIKAFTNNAAVVCQEGRFGLVFSCIIPKWPTIKHT